MLMNSDGSRCLVVCAVAVVASMAGVATAQPFVERIISFENDGMRSARAADLDGDGDLDIISCITDSNTVVLYESDGLSPPNFTPRVIDPNRRRPNFVVFADMNNDTFLDVIVCSSVDDQIAWYESDGQNPVSFTKHIIVTDPDNIVANETNGFSDAPRQVFAVDIDNDGDIDVGAVSVDNDRVALYESDGMDPPTFTPRSLIDDFDGARAINVADVDLDGDLDIIAGAWFDSRALWFENDGNQPAGFTVREIAAGLIESNTWGVDSGDIDGDGDIDLFATRRDARIDWYENNGDTPPTFTLNILTEDIRIGKIIQVIDINEDGHLDMASASFLDDRIAWFENDGQPEPTFITNNLTIDPDEFGDGNGVEGLADGARSVAVHDLDGDGDLDFLWGSRRSNLLAWHENLRLSNCKADLTGDGTVDFADIQRYLQEFFNQSAVGDFNDDGALDFNDVQSYLAEFDDGCE